MAFKSSIRGVDELIDRLESLSGRQDLSLRDVVEEFGDASFLPVITALALVVVSPLSGIFGLSSLMGLTIALLAAQVLLGRSHVWLPDVFMRRTVSGARVKSVAKRLHGLARWLDRNARDRWHLLVAPQARAVLPVAIILCGGVMPLLELLPFSSSMLGMAIVLICTGLLLHDGVFVAGALAFIGAAGALIVYLVL
jgi:hypothetical protein